jgi:hypothetical protein
VNIHVSNIVELMHLHFLFMHSFNLILTFYYILSYSDESH